MPRPPLTLFCELPEAPLRELLATAGVVDELAALGASVSMACPDHSPGRAAMIRTLASRGVGVNAWLVLPPEQGYFATADNSAAVAARCDELVAWLRREALPVTTIGIDVEMDIVHMEALASAPWRLAGPALRGTFAPARTAAAEADYAALIARLHTQGFTVETYQLPPVVDGRTAGSTWLARAFGMMELRADREVLMLYSSALPGGSAWVESYAPFADAIGLGVTGGGTVAVPRMSWEALERDLRIAASTGRPIYLFSLEGCVERGWLGRLRELDWQDGSAPRRSARSAILDGLRALLRGGLRVESALARLQLTRRWTRLKQ